MGGVPRRRGLRLQEGSSGCPEGAGRSLAQPTPRRWALANPCRHLVTSVLVPFPTPKRSKLRKRADVGESVASAADAASGKWLRRRRPRFSQGSPRSGNTLSSRCAYHRECQRLSPNKVVS